MLTHTLLSVAVDCYLATRRATGYELREDEAMLRSFARYAGECGDSHVRTPTAIRWAELAPSPRRRDGRLKVVIRFARYCRAEDERHEVPPDGVFAHSSERRRPYIYSAADIGRLVEAASQLTGWLRPRTYSTLFALLAATGLRVSEALALRLGDVTEDGLVIRETKFRKSRLVPLHPTVSAGIERYLACRRKAAGTADHLFVSERGEGLRYNTVVVMFLRLVRSLGLHPGKGKPGPRIHDLRHTWAVRALERCPHDRRRIGRHMLAVSTYLGHADVDSTYWYLRATPQLMVDIVEACESLASGGSP